MENIIFGHSIILEIFKWIKEKHIAYNDKLKVEEILTTYKDNLATFRHIERNFRICAKEFDLDSPRDNYLDSIIDGFMNTLQGTNPKLLEKGGVAEKLKMLKDNTKK